MEGIAKREIAQPTLIIVSDNLNPGISLFISVLKIHKKTVIPNIINTCISFLLNFPSSFSLLLIS